MPYRSVNRVSHIRLACSRLCTLFSRCSLMHVFSFWVQTARLFLLSRHKQPADSLLTDAWRRQAAGDPCWLLRPVLASACFLPASSLPSVASVFVHGGDRSSCGSGECACYGRGYWAATSAPKQQQQQQQQLLLLFTARNQVAVVVCSAFPQSSSSSRW